MVTSGYKGDAIFPAAVCACRERGKRLLSMVWQTRMRRSVFSIHYPDAAPQCLLAKAPKGTKNAFVPRRQAKTPAVFFDGAELAGGVVWFSSCRQGVGKPLFTLTPAAVCTCWLEQGITAKVEPRRRNCRRAISLAAREKGGKQLLRPFVCLQKDVAAGKEAKGCCQWFGRQAFAQVCGIAVIKSDRGEDNALSPRFAQKF